jgi:hypothetical protein
VGGGAPDHELKKLVAHLELPVEGEMPTLAGATDWLNTTPLRTTALQGLVVVGVHTPEFGVEHDLGNVRRAARDMGVGYPIAIDNDYAVWDGGTVQ